jgi:hypothetical protein
MAFQQKFYCNQQHASKAGTKEVSSPEQHPSKLTEQKTELCTTELIYCSTVLFKQLNSIIPNLLVPNTNPHPNSHHENITAGRKACSAKEKSDPPILVSFKAADVFIERHFEAYD